MASAMAAPNEVDVGCEPKKTEEDTSIKMDRQCSPCSPGVAVTFTDLSYEVPIKKKAPLVILSGLKGCFESGHMTALMGPSGSGKTTLMDIIAGRKSGAGKIEGEILFGGSVMPSSGLKHLVGYVEQFDTLIGELTVEQMLMYTAELKLPRKMKTSEKKQRVHDVIEMLQLSKCRKTVIGNILRRGISGGQAKRVNIGLSLITRPAVLCLDEPTSGLDASMANEVIARLKALTREGCTVLAAVHTPTSFAFSLFDDLFMLQEGGRPIYRGPVAEARMYFESQGHAFPAEVGYGIPDWLVDITRGATGEILDDLDAPKGKDFAALWAQSDTGIASDAKHQEQVAALKRTPAELSAMASSKGPGQLHALRTLLAYRLVTHYKDGEFLGPRIGDKIFMSILAMSIYWGLGDKSDPQSMQSVAGALYFFMALCGYGAAAYVPSLTLERAMFYRERADGCYAAWTYYVSKFIEEAILCILSSLIFSAIVFFSLRLQGSFFVFALAYFLTAMVGIVLAYCVASVAPTMEAANALLPTYVTVCMYFGGLFIVFDKIPVGWQWFSYTSFLRYAWGALMQNQFAGYANGEARVFGEGGSMTILEFYGMSDDDSIMGSIPACLGILCGLLVTFGALGALGLTFISHVKR